MQKRVRSVTINTDASFMHESGLSSYGYWISSANGRKKGSGLFNNLSTDSNDAEIKGIINALHVFFREKWLSRDIELIYINCDNQTAELTLSKNSVKKYEKHYDLFIQILHSNSFNLKNIKFLKIRGHQNSKRGARYYLNNWCDREAKKEIALYFKRDVYIHIEGDDEIKYKKQINDLLSSIPLESYLHAFKNEEDISFVSNISILKGTTLVVKHKRRSFRFLIDSISIRNKQINLIYNEK